MKITVPCRIGDIVYLKQRDGFFIPAEAVMFEVIGEFPEMIDVRIALPNHEIMTVKQSQLCFTMTEAETWSESYIVSLERTKK